MARRTSRQATREQIAKGIALEEFRRAPRVVGVLFSHDDIEGMFALRVSHNEEPHEIHMCKDREHAEGIKAWQRDVSLWGWEEAFQQHTKEFTPWGWKRTTLTEFTVDYFDSYKPEDRGDPNLEPVPL